MPPRSLINGQPSTTLDSSDRGLHFGDGLFETLAVHNGRCEFWDRHMLRLHAGCSRLRIPRPDTLQLEAEAAQLTQAVKRGVLKIIITRGSGGHGYRTPASPQPTRVLICKDWPEYPAEKSQQGVCVRLCEQILGSNPALAGIKHLNRLEQVLARLEWDTPAFTEGLLRDASGHVIEGTYSNVFMVRQGSLITPQLDQCGVAGILRDVVLELATAAGIDCTERAVSLAELYTADELFLTNSLIGIWPIRALEYWQRKPGPTTRLLQAALTQQRQQPQRDAHD